MNEPGSASKNIPTLVTRRSSSKAREGRMASHSTDEVSNMLRTSWAGCMGGLGVPLELGCLLINGALPPEVALAFLNSVEQSLAQNKDAQANSATGTHSTCVDRPFYDQWQEEFHISTRANWPGVAENSGEFVIS